MAESIVNRIDPLNLTPILALLYRIQYQFGKNRNDVLSQLDSEINDINSQISRVEQRIQDSQQGSIINTNELQRLNVNTKGCTVADRNKRNKNITDSLKNRRSELQSNLSEVKTERESNRQFYKLLLDTIGDLLRGIIQLLINLLDIIGQAIAVIETAISSLAAIPLGAGLAGVAVFSFVKDLLQLKIFEPVKDTVDQQKYYEENAPRLEESV